jgi:hypothetical protein
MGRPAKIIPALQDHFGINPDLSLHDPNQPYLLGFREICDNASNDKAAAAKISDLTGEKLTTCGAYPKIYFGPEYRIGTLCENKGKKSGKSGAGKPAVFIPAMIAHFGSKEAFKTALEDAAAVVKDPNGTPRGRTLKEVAGEINKEAGTSFDPANFYLPMKEFGIALSRVRRPKGSSDSESMDSEDPMTPSRPPQSFYRGADGKPRRWARDRSQDPVGV